MLHSLAGPDGPHDNWDYDVARFEKLCRLLRQLQDQGRLTVATTMDIYQAMREE